MPRWIIPAIVVVSLALTLSLAGLLILARRGGSGGSGSGQNDPWAQDYGLEGLVIPPFMLIDQEARPVDETLFEGRITIIDFIFRLLGLEYMGRTDLVQVKPNEQQLLDLASVKSQTEKTPGATPAAKPSSPPQLAVIQGERAEPVEGKAENTLSDHLSTMMGDAPFCDQCGHITVRNGACYKCLNCGNSMGCS